MKFMISKVGRFAMTICIIVIIDCAKSSQVFINEKFWIVFDLFQNYTINLNRSSCDVTNNDQFRC